MPIDYRPLIYKSCIGRANRERADLEGVAPETDEVEGKATEILKAAKARLRNFSEKFQQKFTPLPLSQLFRD